MNRNKNSLFNAVSALGMTFGDYDSVSDLIVPHLILDPFYVQTYVTSAFVSLQIFFEEIETKGNGLALYKSLIYRNENLDFNSYIDLVGLDSPFNEETVKSIADSMHYIILGSHYFEESDGDEAA